MNLFACQNALLSVVRLQAEFARRMARSWSKSVAHYEDFYSHNVPSMEENELALFKLYRPERVTPKERGAGLLREPHLNKGMAFTLHERQHLGLHGLLPPAFMTQEQQAYRVITKLREQPNDLARYIQLDSLQDRNEKLYYRVLCDHVKELMPIVYTPTVGLACQNFGYIYRKPKGLYITINDNSISKIYQILSNWPERDIRAIVVTDGERILGLGDLGAYGIGIPVGKLALYVALGGVQPRWCLPVLLDVGTDNMDLLKDPFYTGLRQRRVRGKDYDQLIENFLKASTKRFGHMTLIQFEDFANANAFRLLNKFRDRYTVFNDDIQGTAAAIVAGLLTCARVLRKPLSKQKYLFFGAGAASTGIAELLIRQMCREGVPEEEACRRVYLMDVDGLVTKNRKKMNPRHIRFAKDMPKITSILEVIKQVRPSALIGASTVQGAFTEEVIRTMAQINRLPIIFALSNPTNRAECTAEQAYKFTDGAVLYASGSPFANVELNGRTLKPGQGNNAYIFPGIALGAILFQIRHIDTDLFLFAAKKVAASVTEQNISMGCIYPELKQIREISVQIAVGIAEHCYNNGTANLYPKPEDLEKYVRSQMYYTEYEELINATYDWPERDMKHGLPVSLHPAHGIDG